MGAGLRGSDGRSSQLRALPGHHGPIEGESESRDEDEDQLCAIIHRGVWGNRNPWALVKSARKPPASTSIISDFSPSFPPKSHQHDLV